MKLGQYLNELSGKSNTGFKGTDEVGRFLVVTKPADADSTLADILFYADVFDMVLQFRGGLKGEDIVGIYSNYAKAKKIATKLIKDISA